MSITRMKFNPSSEDTKRAKELIKEYSIKNCSAGSIQMGLYYDDGLGIPYWFVRYWMEKYRSERK